MYVCDICEERLCKDCKFGNPCLDCPDYDRTKDDCKSNGACALTGEEKMDKEYRNAHKKWTKNTEMLIKQEAYEASKD